jgi:hypothetical protein
VASGSVSESGRVLVDITPKGGANSVRSRIDGGREHDDASDSTPHRPSSAIARRLFEETVSEAEYWDTVLSNAIDNANGCLDLS